MSIIRVSSHGLGNSLLLVLDLYLCDGPSDNIMATRGLENTHFLFAMFLFLIIGFHRMHSETCISWSYKYESYHLEIVLNVIIYKLLFLPPYVFLHREYLEPKR